MSIDLLRQDKAQVVDLCQQLLEKLCFPRLARPQIEGVRMHFDAIKLDPRVMTTTCSLSADGFGKTKIVLEFDFIRENPVQ